jgi:SAM-dependent methyltransferase
MRQQRLVFGEVAELYDRARAGYPEALIDDVIGFTGRDGSSLRALEVGAGTGKATEGFASRGPEILALEPSADMAAVARRNCQRFPKVRVETTSFEDWPAQAGGFGLLFSAQAWHWVSPEIRYRKAAEVLGPGGTLALFWHRVRWHGEPVRDELESLYRRLAPDLYARRPGFPGLIARTGDGAADDEIRQTGVFGDVMERTYPWPATFTADSFVELLMTQSDHRLLPEDKRCELLDAVRELITRHGGEVVIPHATLLVLAHLRPGSG